MIQNHIEREKNHLEREKNHIEREAAASEMIKSHIKRENKKVSDSQILLLKESRKTVNIGDKRKPVNFIIRKASGSTERTVNMPIYAHDPQP
jgi:hypothetical protein